MGQRLFFPPNVAGWPGGLAWLDGQAVVARANVAAWLTEPSTWGGNDRFSELAGRHGWKTPAGLAQCPDKLAASAGPHVRKSGILREPGI